MGTCNKALLLYGIIIPGPKAVAFLNALRKLPPPPKKSTEWDTDEIEDPKAWEHEYDEELGKRIESQFVAAGFDWEELELQTLGSFEEPEGVAVFFNGLYGKKENCCANGLEVEFWGTEGSFPHLSLCSDRTQN